MRRTALVLTLMLTVASAARAATVDPPLRVNIKKLDQSPLNGLITSYTDSDFELMDLQKQTRKVAWEELPPGEIMSLHARLVRKGSSEEWFTLGKKLLTMPGGRAPAEQAFQRAVKLDPNLKDQIAQARKDALTATPPTRTGPPTLSSPTPPPDARAGAGSAGAGAGSATQPGVVVEPVDPAKRVIGPQVVGTPDPAAWVKPLPQQAAEALAAQKAFGASVQQKINPQLVLHETPVLLVYTDLPAAGTQQAIALLDRTYAQLATLFALPKGENVFRGKGVVFLFAKDKDYHQFQMKMHDGVIATGTAGMTHVFANGDVHVALFRQRDEASFNQAIAHETAHAFLQRYRSHATVPAWVAQGFADVMAGSIAPRTGATQEAQAAARADLTRRKGFDKMFERDHLVVWQRPVARTLAQFMFDSSKPGYVDFINAIKDGVPWDEALAQKYGVTLPQLVRSYGMSIGVANLEP